jgi:sec-independent protein translocase protein TatA
MPNVGPLEIAVVAIIALLVFGPKRLPELGRSVGKGIREFKGSITGDDENRDPKAAIEAANEDAGSASVEAEVVGPTASVGRAN